MKIPIKQGRVDIYRSLSSKLPQPKTLWMLSRTGEKVDVSSRRNSQV